MNKYKLVALSVSGGILSGLAWTGWCSGLILLFSLVPFLLIGHILYADRKKYIWNAPFVYTLPGFVIFNIIAIGWIRVFTMTGAIFIILGLSFLMAFTMWLAHIIRLKSGTRAGYIALVSFWLALEFLNLNIKILTPWLNLGNGLAKDILFIQWYEITGTSGGTLWILVSNITFSFWLVESLRSQRLTNIYLWTGLAIVLVPSIMSVIRFNTINTRNTDGIEVVIIQPNVDPYTEKFTMSFQDQWQNVISMAESAISEKTSWVITPETTIDDPVNEYDTYNNYYLRSAREFLSEYPDASIVAGMVSYKIYTSADLLPSGGQDIIDESGLSRVHFNSAFRIDTGMSVEIYHKSKLVPGVEMQLSNTGQLLNRVLPYYGGTKWGYGIQEERICFEDPSGRLTVAPVICFESVFGSFVAEYVRKGAEAIFIITNDGWWKNTNGYNQHLSYASLRAIETRRPVARAANTGISAIIDIKGTRTVESEWWTRTVITGTIYPEIRLTPYVKYGDYLMRIASFISILILLIVFIAIPLRRKN